MKALYNKSVAYIFFLFSILLVFFGKISYSAIGNFYATASRDNMFFQQNPTNDGVFHDMQVGAFALFFLLALNLFGLGWIILNFAIQKEKQQS
jgi:hypothetical protein